MTTYLVMDVDFEPCPGTLIIFMIKYLSAMIEEWVDELKGHKVPLHDEHLFKIRPSDERELLQEGSAK